MSVSLNNLTIDQLDTVRFAANVLLAISMVVVWLGVVFEGEKFSAKIQSRAWRILVWGLAAETFLAVAIWQIDTAASDKLHMEVALTERDVAEANAKTAAAQRDLAILRGQTTRRWPDGRKMVSFLRLAPGRIDIWFGKEDVDSATVAIILGKIFRQSGWTVLGEKPVPVLELAKETWGEGWYSLQMPALAVTPEGFVGKTPEELPSKYRTPLGVLTQALSLGFGPINFLLRRVAV